MAKVVIEELTKVKVELATAVENNTMLMEEITSKDASLIYIRNKEMQIRKIAKKYKLQYEELAKTVRNKEMQFRKIAKKYKLQYEDLAKTVEEDKKRIKGDAAAADAATAESAKKLELQLTEIRSQLSSSLYLLLTEKANNEKLKQELQTLRTANTFKEEKAKIILKKAKNKIVQLTVLKNSLSRELEESHTKIGGIEQRLALIKSQYECCVSRLEKERGEVQAEKNREVEALQHKVTMLKRQLASQASASRQQTASKKTTTDPPTANIKPMAGVAHAMSRALASIRPMAQVRPTAPNDAHTTELMPASSSRPLPRAVLVASTPLIESTQDMDTSDSDSDNTAQPPSHSQAPEQSGNFVLLKSDVKWDGDTVTTKLDKLTLWKIVGERLTQKFIPMKSRGKILHKCTCVYSGWNVDNCEDYYFITEILDRNPRTNSNEICVALDLNDLIKVRHTAPLDATTESAPAPSPRAPPRPAPAASAAPLDSTQDMDTSDSDSDNSSQPPSHSQAPQQSGNFVLVKSDVKWDGDTVTTKLDELNLWKIEGRALLQKFIPMESSGWSKILHRCTCVYTGWNVDNCEDYYFITEILDRNPRTNSKETCVALDLNDLIKVRDKKIHGDFLFNPTT